MKPILIGLLLLVPALCGLAQVAVPDFSFIHVSDIHAGAGVSAKDDAKIIGAIPALGAFEMTKYGVTAPPPSFVIATGDVTEFGGQKSWDLLQTYLQDIKVPIYYALGNHDGTWDGFRPLVRKANGAAYYSFDSNKVHFIVLDSSGLQDPRPMFTMEELNWMAEDLKKLDASAPVVVAFHHPLPGTEFPGAYSQDILLDMLRPYNVVLMLVGHGHSPVYNEKNDISQVQGGSPYRHVPTANPGYNIVYFSGDSLRVVYNGEDAAKPLLDKKIPARSDYPRITILSPDPVRLAAGLGDIATPTQDRVNRALLAVMGSIPAQKLTPDAKVSVLAKNHVAAFADALGTEFGLPLGPENSSELARNTLGGVSKSMDDAIAEALNSLVKIAAKIEDASGPIESADYDIDGGEVKGPLTLDGDIYKAEAQLDKLLPGAHNVRINFNSGGKVFHKSSRFYVENGKTYAKWRAVLGGSSKSTPTIADGVVYTAAADGKLYAFDAATGKPKWTFMTGGEILGQPLVVDKLVYIGSGDSKFYAVNTTDGKKKWEFQAERAIYSSPVWVAGSVLFGCNSGAFYCLDADAGSPRWVNRNAGYTIEIKPFACGSSVYYGAWDGLMYAVNMADGSLLWKAQSKGSTNRYYSPADCGPVATETHVFCADRASVFTIFDAKTGQIISSQKQASGVGIAENIQAVYVRKTDGNLAKEDLDGNLIWAVNCGMGAIPTAPTEKDNVAYVASGLGLISAISADKGSILWQYRSSPQLWVMSSVSADNGTAYVSGMDGTLTAIVNR